MRFTLPENLRHHSPAELAAEIYAIEAELVTRKVERSDRWRWPRSSRRDLEIARDRLKAELWTRSAVLRKGG